MEPGAGEPGHHQLPQEPAPHGPSSADDVRQSVDRFAQALRAEIRLLMTEVRGLNRDVRALMAEVCELFDTLTLRLGNLEDRVAWISDREPPADPPKPARRCGRRPRPTGH